MTINWKIWAPVGIVVVIVFVAIGLNQVKTNDLQEANVDNKQTQEQPIVVSQDLPSATLKPATGNIDDVVNSILAGVSDDEALFADAVKDGELINSDSQSINNFGQSYNENEF